MAAKIILDRIAPVSRRQCVSFDLPKIESLDDEVAARAAVLGAVANGDLTPGEAVFRSSTSLWPPKDPVTRPSQAKAGLSSCRTWFPWDEPVNDDGGCHPSAISASPGKPGPERQAFSRNNAAGARLRLKCFSRTMPGGRSHENSRPLHGFLFAGLRRLRF
jgi:hypothetical protein